MKEDNYISEKIRDSEYDPNTKTYQYIFRSYKIPKYKPIVSYWKSGDPNKSVELLRSKITEITIIRLKYISPKLKDILIKNKDKVFLHIVVSGLNSTMFEPNIPMVKEVFYQIKDLVDSGFPVSHILINVDPVIQNENGMKVLKLILRVFTEIKDLRLRKIRISLLWYHQDTNGKYSVANQFIRKRRTTQSIEHFIVKTPDFMKEYYQILNKYSSIINVDNGDEPIIGIRELRALGYKNEWIDENDQKRRIIEYEDTAKKYKPIVNVISGKSVRCQNKCLLCPYFG